MTTPAPPGPEADHGLPGWWVLLLIPALGAIGAVIVLLLGPRVWESDQQNTPIADALAAYPTPPPVRFETPTPRPTVPPTATLPPPLFGERMPDRTFELLDGGTLRLAEWEGAIVFLNIWATWCVPCREEMPELQAVSAGRDDVRVLAITDPFDGQTPDDIRAFMAEYALTLPVALESDRAFYQLLQVRQIPTTFIIDQTGMVRFWHVGELHEHDIVDYLAALTE